MKKSSMLGTIFLALILVMTVGSPGWAADPIRIAIVGPMQFTQGEGHWNGATMAAEAINKEGGI